MDSGTCNVGSTTPDGRWHDKRFNTFYVFNMKVSLQYFHFCVNKKLAA